MLTGTIDVSSESLPLDLAQQFESRMGDTFNVYYNKGTSCGVMPWNISSPWFSDKRVRQAFYYGIDRALVTKKAMVGNDPVLSPISSGSAYFKPVLAKYSYDPDKANALLDAAGWKWNAAHTQRTLPDGTAAVLKVPFSQGAAFREREITLMQPMLTKLASRCSMTPWTSMPSWTPRPMERSSLPCMVSALTITISMVQCCPSAVTRFLLKPMACRARTSRATRVPIWTSGCMQHSRLPRVLLSTRPTPTFRTSSRDLPTFYLEQRMYPDEVRKGLKGYDHFFSSTVYNVWNVQYWYWFK